MNGRTRTGAFPNLPGSVAVYLKVGSMTVTTLIAALPLLASCASSGLYSMSDDWCAAHPSATAARCPENPEHPHANDSLHFIGTTTPR